MTPPSRLAASVWTAIDARRSDRASSRAGAIMGERCDQLFRHCGSAARRLQIERLGPTAWQSSLLEWWQMKILLSTSFPLAKALVYRYARMLEHAADAFLQFEYFGGIGANCVTPAAP